MEANQKFGRWTLVRASNGGWLCVCECGTTRVVRTEHLKAGNSKSCGCGARYGRNYKTKYAEDSNGLR